MTITLPSDADCVALLGSAEKNLKILREALGIRISARDRAIHISGDDRRVQRAAGLIEELAHAARSARPISPQDLLERLSLDPDGEAADWVSVYAHGKRVGARTPGQTRYLQAIAKHDLVFCCGPAGTGKTYLAVAAAVSMLKRGVVRRIILARPAVEAGEKLGFLPGDLQQKVHPYLRPLLDALHDMMSYEQVQRFLQTDVIEVIPLAFMRGRTFNSAAIILDEAQNTTRGQMLMFLTRMGLGSKMVVTGDTSQIDLPENVESGLIDAVRRLRTLSEVARVTLEQTDIVRHTLVQSIVEAYGAVQTAMKD